MKTHVMVKLGLTEREVDEGFSVEGFMRLLAYMSCEAEAMAKGMSRKRVETMMTPTGVRFSAS